MNKYWQEISNIFKYKNVWNFFYLNDGASSSQIESLELLTQLQLPQSVRSFYQVHDGEIAFWKNNNQASSGLFFGWELLPIKLIIEIWQTWSDIQVEMNQELAEDMSSYPPDHIKNLYANNKWIPLVHDREGNHVGIDFDPDIRGIKGQVILFGRDEDEKRLLANSFEELIEKFIYFIKNKEWDIDKSGNWKINEQDHYNFFHSYYRIKL